MKDLRIKPALLLACIGVQALPLAAHAAPFHTVDVLGIYSEHTAQQVADPEALFVRNIEYANKALLNSRANYRYNLVSVELQNWGDDEELGEAQLKSFTSDSTINQLREDYGADLVAGMVLQSNRLCGIGWLPPANKATQTFYDGATRYGYSLSGHSCGGRTMAHEMGHNMGLGHSPAQGSEGTLADWGRGWGVNGSFVTIMAYDSAYGVNTSGRIQIHSNPALLDCKKKACGKDINEQNGADATQALNLASPQTSAWIASVVTVPENNPPVAENDSASTNAGQTVTINVLQNDSDPDKDKITIGSVSAPANGIAEIQSGATQIAYTPNEGFDGSDSFTYTITDSHGEDATAAVSVDVIAVPDGNGSTNLAINGGAENGLEGWFGAWGLDISVSSDAKSGASSIQASGAGGAFIELNAPIAGNQNLAISAWLKANSETKTYIYLRLHQGGSWQYQYVAATTLPANMWVNLNETRHVTGPQIDDGRLLFYFSTGMDKVVIDKVSVKKG
ncbi:MAG: hypothetical protein GY938_06430 [Ketobacter sp.]|nr:hypothetical protein [Ketobacter sp.]